MSEATFTPGPWRIGTANGYNASNIYTDDGENGICQMYGIALHRTVDEIQGDPGIANARLVAACPTMYNALEQIAAHDPETCNGLTPRDCVDAMREIARAALAKARGK